MAIPAIAFAVGKGILMTLGGLSLVGSVANLAQRRGNKAIDLDEYTWLNDEEEYVDWDNLSLEEQSITLRGIRDGSLEL
jgi:hypothetical protein